MSTGTKSQSSGPSTAVRVMYKPFGLASSLLGASIAGFVFKKVWKRMGTDDNDVAPGALREDYSLVEILSAAVVQGVIFAVVKTTVDRTSARVFKTTVGEWPA